MAKGKNVNQYTVWLYECQTLFKYSIKAIKL